jgi:hypothetical protein
VFIGSRSVFVFSKGKYFMSNISVDKKKGESGREMRE